jgi:GNAT superfamily N-acetyltransferase
VREAPAGLEVRAPAGDGEIDVLFGLMTDTFVRAADPRRAAATWRRFVAEAPGQPAGRLRGAFLDGRCVGGYLLDRRIVHLAGAAVPAGGIGAVVVDRSRRAQGIGTALMRDSFEYARSHGLALLVLHGAPRYYSPFGYVDVFDSTCHRVRRRDVAALGPSSLEVRAATPDDAGAVLELYRESFERYSGWSARSLAEEQHLLRFGALSRAELGDAFDSLGTVVAVAPSGEVRGYLRQLWGALSPFGCEATALDRPAVLALARHHAAARGPLQGGDDDIAWQLPPDSLTAALLADELRVDVEATRRPQEGWMAALTDAGALLGRLASAWTPVLGPREALVIRVGTSSCRIGSAGAPAQEVTLDEATLLPLLFGSRPLRWACLQPGCALAGGGALAALLDGSRAWIPPSNGC